MSAFDSLGTLGTGIGALVSVGSSIFGGIEGSRSASDAAREEQQIAQLDMQAEAQRRTAMELTSRRQQTQTIRNQQMARSMALTGATSQGAQFGTGLQGGYASIAGKSGVNQLATSQNMQIGENLFNINNQIDAARMELSKDQAGIADASAFSSLGGAIGKSLGPLGSFFTSPAFTGIFSGGQ